MVCRTTCCVRRMGIEFGVGGRLGLPVELVWRRVCEGERRVYRVAGVMRRTGKCMYNNDPS
jgi:hypothetical protein